MTEIKTKRERVKFASDNVTGACPEVLNALLKANDEDKTPYGNDELSKNLQNKFSEIFEKEVIVFPTASGTASNALAASTFVLPVSLATMSIKSALFIKSPQMPCYRLLITLDLKN